MIEIESVAKTYVSPVRRLRVEALADFSLTVPRGEVLGIAGPNGAGKSTLLSLLLGYLHPSHGRLTIAGQAPRAYIERHGVSYLTELIAIPPRWTTENALRRMAALSNLPGATARRRTDEVIALLGLAEHRRKQIRQLSKGNLQRVGIAQALVVESDLVIFDEPTHGLDPVWTQKFRDIVQLLRSPSRTMIIASHNLDELERLTDRVVILGKGRLQRIVTAGESQDGGAYRLALAAPSLRLAEIFPEATMVEGRVSEWRVQGTLDDLNLRLRRLIEAGAVVAGFYPERSRLESEFHATVQGERP